MANSEPTTALETLGTFLTGNETRDAIHLAVVPITATERLFPGQHVTADGKSAGEPVGIVDPFLPGPVQIGQRFWLTLYPRTITSLRHAWTHPAFPEVGITADAAPAELTDVQQSEAWIANFAVQLDQTVSRLMSAAEQWEYSSPNSTWGGEYTMDNTEAYKNIEEATFIEFWRHYEIVKGAPLAEGVKRESFFTCSC